MERNLDVLVVCEINVDIVVTGLAGPPKFGAEQSVGGVAITAGSSGVLTATGLAALGLSVGVCGMVGDDLFGRFMLDHLDAWHIDRSAVAVDSSVSTGSSVSLSTAVDRAILTYPGAMARFSASRIPADVVQRARHVHMSSYFLQSGLQDGIADVLDEARTAGSTVSADTGHDPDEQWNVNGLLAHLDVFMPNEVEALAISGKSSVPEALDWLHAHVPCVAIKCGGNGAVAVRGAEHVIEGPYPITVLDTTGAGDAFDAGFLGAWLSGGDLRTCVLQGNACGALTASHIGGTGAISRAKVQALLETQRL